MYLAVWFQIVISCSIFEVVFGERYPIIMIIANLFYVYSLYQRRIKVKYVAIWIHWIISGLGGVIAAIIYYVTIPLDVNVTGSYIPILVFAALVMYVLITIPIGYFFWKHYKVSKEIAEWDLDPFENATPLPSENSPSQNKERETVCSLQMQYQDQFQ